MADARSETAAELALLRRALTEIEPRLEGLEEWRALRQLDERERNGNPLEGMDGVLFRGRLVQRLAETSRDWRAYVRIEEAIGQLLGPKRLEPGILKESTRFDVAPPVSAAPVIPVLAPPATETPARTAVAATTTAPSGTTATTATDSALGQKPATAAHLPQDSQDTQRLRVKVRAGSSHVAAPAATPVAVILQSPSVAPEVPAVASLTPRPSPLPEPGPVELAAAVDQRSPRSVLQRIRLVSKIRPLDATTRNNEGEAGLLGAPSAPLIETTPVPQQPRYDSPSSSGAAIHAPSPGLAQPPAGGQAAALPARIVPAHSEPAITDQRRLNDLEAELEILIDKSASWPHPLDAQRSKDLRDAPRAAPSHATLEPDATVDLDVDEAEVTIIRHAEPIEPEIPASSAARGREPASWLPIAARPETTGEVDGSDYAGYRLELEEASVEIVVTDGQSEPAPPADNYRGFRRPVLTGE